MKTNFPACRVALIAALWATAASAADGYAHKVPEGFKPLDKVMAIDANAAGSAGPATIDLGWGATAGQCPTGAWTGTVRFVGHAGGDIEYTGQMYRCFTYGTGTARYPDGSSYTGRVSAYLTGDGERLDTNNVRMAVREGSGQHTRADGTVVSRTFSRGVAGDAAAAAGGKKGGGMFGAIGAAFAEASAASVDGSAQSLSRSMDQQAAGAEAFAQRADQQAAGTEAFMQRAGQEAASVEPFAQRAGQEAAGAGAFAQRAGQEAAGAESFAQRAAQEASGAGDFAQRAGQEIGLGGGSKGGKGKKKGGVDVVGGLTDVGTFTQQNSNSAPGGPKYDAGAKIDNALGGALGGGATANASGGGGGGGGQCLTGTWRRPICGGSEHKAEVWFSGGPQGQGYVKDQDCASVCPDGRRFDFNYTLNGDGSMQVDYTGGQICGTPQTPSGGRQPFSCKGDSLKFGNDYKKVR